MSAQKNTQNGDNKKRVSSLLVYLKGISSEEATDKFAKDCGTTTGNLMQIAYGGSVSAKLSKKIHEESKKKVLLTELRPDIFC